MTRRWYHANSILQPHRMRNLGGADSGGPAFYPTTLPDPLLILDAIQSPYTDAGSGKVSQWNDLSGNNNHAVQSTSTNQPTYEATGLNSLPTMRLGANPVRFDLTSAIVGGSQTIYLALSIDTLEFNGLLGNSDNSSGLILFNTSGGRCELFGGSGFTDSEMVRSDGVAFLLTSTNPVVAGVKAYKNGTLQTNTLGGTTGSVTIGRIGYADSSSFYNKFNGRLSGLYIYGSVHDDTTRAAMEAWLISRWGIT